MTEHTHTISIRLSQYHLFFIRNWIKSLAYDPILNDRIEGNILWMMQWKHLLLIDPQLTTDPEKGS